METFPFFDWKTSVTQLQATGLLGDIPLLVLTSNNFHLSAEGEQVALEMQKELASLSSNGTLVVVEGNEMIAETQPERVIDAIRSVLDSVRGE